MDLGADAVVRSVTPRGAAADAGIVAGDRLISRPERSNGRSLYTPGYKPAGTALVVTVVHGSGHRDVRLLSRAQTPAPWPFIAAVITALAFVGVALILVTSRPSALTWAFYLFACGYVIAQFGSLWYFASGAYRTVYVFAAAVALAMTIFGGTSFVLRFPYGTTRGVNAWLPRFVVPAALVAVTLFLLRALLPLPAGGAGGLRPLVNTIYNVVVLAILTVTVVAVLYRHQRSTGEERARGLWVIAGSTVGLGALIVDEALLVLNVSSYEGSPLQSLLRVAIVCIPASVAYAVLRHRVIDVRFVINRALVFGILTTALVLAFSLVEWILGKELEATRLALYVEIGLALIVGLSFDRLKTFVDRVVEHAFFQRERAAAERLQRATEALPHAGAAETVDDLLTSEPLAAYRLSSAALFRRVEGNRFERSVALGWNGEGDTAVSVAEPLVAYLSAASDGVALDGTPHRVALPSGSAQPVLAVPVSFRHHLLAFALYGAHQSGETLDPEERSTLRALATAAAAAYDHLDALHLREELAALQRRVATLNLREPPP